MCGLAWYCQDPSRLSQMAVFHLFSWLSSVPPYIDTTSSLSNHLARNTSVVSMSLPPWVMLLLPLLMLFFSMQSAFLSHHHLFKFYPSLESSAKLVEAWDSILLLPPYQDPSRAFRITMIIYWEFLCAKCSVCIVLFNRQHIFWNEAPKTEKLSNFPRSHCVPKVGSELEPISPTSQH